MKEQKSKKKESAGSAENAGGAGSAGGGWSPAFALREGAYIAHGAVREGGAILLVYEISLPAFLEGEETGRQARAEGRLAAFYARIAEEIWSACEGRLFPSVRRAYDACEDSYKKYRFARYTLTVDFTETRAAGEIVILRHARLLRRGRVICERAWEERFCERNGRVQLRRLSRLLSRIRPKQGLRETLKRVISRHTGGF